MAGLTFPRTNCGLFDNAFSLKEIPALHKRRLVLVNFA